ncbi:hypothetical protein BH20ACT5_BH20ACT5_21400 [soil metagenome]
MAIHFRRWRAVAPIVLALLAAQGLVAPPAAAHNALASTTPADGAELPTVPAEVTLTFDGPVSPDFAQVVVTGPDGAGWQAGAPRVSGATVTQPLAEPALAGTYEVGWRVVSSDGHPISGTFSFDVAAAPITTTAPQSTVPTAAPAETSDPAETATATAVASATPETSSNWLPLGIGLLILLLAAGAGAYLLSRRRSTPGSG